MMGRNVNQFPNGLELPVMTFRTLVGCVSGWDAAGIMCAH